MRLKNISSDRTDLGDKCIQNFRLGMYILGYTVGNLAGLILAKNDDGSLKWANGPYPIQIHANFQILMGHLNFLWALCKIRWAQETLINIHIRA